MTDPPQSPVREPTAQEAAEIFATWLSALAAAVDTGSVPDLEELFTEDATWRDFMAFTWDFTHAIGRDAVVERLAELAKAVGADGFEVNGRRPGGDRRRHRRLLRLHDREPDRPRCARSCP